MHAKLDLDKGTHESQQGARGEGTHGSDSRLSRGEGRGERPTGTTGQRENVQMRPNSESGLGPKQQLILGACGG